MNGKVHTGRLSYIHLPVWALVIPRVERRFPVSLQERRKKRPQIPLSRTVLCEIGRDPGVIKFSLLFLTHIILLLLRSDLI